MFNTHLAIESTIKLIRPKEKTKVDSEYNIVRTLSTYTKTKFPCIKKKETYNKQS